MPEPCPCPQEEFGYNAETQRLLCRNGESLLGALNFFVSSTNTLVHKTMDDTLMTVKQYEAARWAPPGHRPALPLRGAALLPVPPLRLQRCHGCATAAPGVSWPSSPLLLLLLSSSPPLPLLHALVPAVPGWSTTRTARTWRS